MSSLIKLLLVVALGFGVYLYIQDRPSNSDQDNPLIGEWKSHKGKSMRELQKGGLTSEQEHVLKSILGKMRMTVTQTTWRSVGVGADESGTYEITSRQDDCFNLRLGNNETRYVCLVDGDMHVQTQFRGNFEVFVRADL